MIYPNRPQTTAAVAAHYDELDLFYREVWGEHVHHGFWATGRESRLEAVEMLVDFMATRLDLAPGQTICDIGCGYGATAVRLAERHGVHVTGVTVSGVQATIASAKSRSHGGIAILHRDWLRNGFPNGQFDRAYAIESSEHMPDKRRFFAEAYRTLRPGGRLAVCAWLARDRPRPWEARYLLEPICREGRLPSLGDEGDYRRLAAAAGFTVAECEDLSSRVRRTWYLCAGRLAGKLMSKPRYVCFLLDSRAADRSFILTLLRLLLAYQTGSMRYCLLVFDKGLS
jgi:tocopherol O-methyltransferase